ncbi:MAG: Ig-like domain-containing protein, partial [Chloroflexales bacterium]
NWTVLSGDLEQNDPTDPFGVVDDPTKLVGTNAIHVVLGAKVTKNTVLDGFIVTAGNASVGYSDDSYGGGMLNDGSSPTLNYVVFRGNRANYGGGMYVLGGNPTLNNVTFSHNSASVNGGGMDNDGRPTLSNVFFSDNSAATGGGMSNSSVANPTLITVTFSLNSATRSGGGMINYGNATLTNVTFKRNSASGGGGMINYGNATLTNVTFANNHTKKGDGGGMYTLGGNATLSNVTFRENSANYGGGMYNCGDPALTRNGNPTLTNVTFDSNSASSYGGGMYNESGNPTLTNVIFRNNSTETENGGGMFNESGKATLTNVIFTGNSAKRNGGGMFNEGNPTLTNVTIRDNTAGDSGGGVYNNTGTFTLINSLVDGNTAKKNSKKHQTGGTVNPTTSVVSSNTSSKAKVKRDKNGKITDASGLQIGTTCPATDIAGVTRNKPCTVGAEEFTGKLTGSTKTSALRTAATLASQPLTWEVAAGTVTLDLPSEAITQPTWLFYDPAVATEPALMAFTLSAASDGTFEALPALAFAVPVTLTIPFTTTAALELRRYDATAGVWTTEGSATVDQTATSLSFALTQTGEYALFPLPTSVWIETRASSPVGLQSIPGDTLLTYEVTLHNASQAPASGVVVSDTLPLGVTFDTWVSQDTATFDGTQITWQPADIAEGGSASISFTARASSAADYLGQTIVNSAAYTLGDTSASAQVAFSLNGPPSLTVISMTTPSNTPLTIVPLLLGISNPDGSSITLSIGTPQHGSATLFADTIIYTPTADFLGNDSFSYTVQDGAFSVSSEVQVRVADLAFPFVGQSVDTRTVMPRQTLTYTLSLGNGDEAAVQQGTITITLPISLTFGAWLTQDMATLVGRTIIWGPSNVALNTRKTISFTVVVDKAAEGTSIASTAQFTATNADPASATLTLDVLVPERLYLPVLGR